MDAMMIMMLLFLFGIILLLLIVILLLNRVLVKDNERLERILDKLNAKNVIDARDMELI